MIAIGIGCRRGSAKDSIVKLVREALAGVEESDGAVELFSVEDKQDETGLIEAAAVLQWPLHFLSHAALQQVEAAVVTPSRFAEAALGLTSVSEAAALAGAGRGAQLIVPRMTRDGVTCAIALGGGR